MGKHKIKVWLSLLVIVMFSLLFVCNNINALGAGHRHDVNGQTQYCDAEHPHHTYRVCKTCRQRVYDGGTYKKSNCYICNNNMKPCSHTGARYTDSSHPHPVYCRQCNKQLSSFSRVNGCPQCNTHTHDVSGQTQYCDAEHPHYTYRVCKTCRQRVYDGGTYRKDNCSQCHPELQCSHTGAKYIDPNHPHPVYCRTCSAKLSSSSTLATCPICSPAPTESKIGIRISSSLTSITSSGVISIDQWGSKISIVATGGGVPIKSIQLAGKKTDSKSGGYIYFTVDSEGQTGIYQVKVTTELGTTLTVSFTVKYQVKATASIKYRTKGIQVQNIEVSRMLYKSGVNRYVPLVGASSISESTKMDLARSNITENDGRTYLFKGSLVIEVYDSAKNKVLGTYNVARDWQKLCSDYKWGANTLGALATMQNAEIAYQAPFPVVAKANYIKQYKNGQNLTYKTVTAQNMGCNDFIFPYECKTLRFASELPPSGFYYHGVQWTDKGVTSSSTTSSAYNVVYTKQSGNVVVNFYYKELTGSVTVNVINASTGTPISGVNISGSHSGKTDTSGKFFVPDVATGTYSYTASATGFQSASKSVSTTASMPNGVVTIALTPIQTVGNITVNVRDASTNASIAGADITGSHSGTTNSSGQVIFRNIPIGTYSYTASAFGYNSVSKSITTTASSPSATITIYLSSKEIRGDITVNVLDAQSRKPISGANVIGSQNGTTNSSGQVVFRNVPIGTYFYRATAIGYEPSSSQSITTTNAEPSKTVTILLGDQRGDGQVEITVIDGFTGAPISGANITGSHSGTTDNNGQVTFNALAFDTYWYSASALGYTASNTAYLTITEAEPVVRYTITLLTGTDGDSNTDLASITINITDYVTKKPLEGVKQGGFIPFACTQVTKNYSNADGQIIYTNVPPDVQFPVCFSKNGYKTLNPWKLYYVPATPGYKMVLNFEMIPLDVMSIIHVYDAETKLPVKNAYVYGVNEFYPGYNTPNAYQKKYTDDTGLVVFSDYPPIDQDKNKGHNDYAYWVDADGYKKEEAFVYFVYDRDGDGTFAGNIQHVDVYLHDENYDRASLSAELLPPRVKAGQGIFCDAITQIKNGNEWIIKISKVTATLPDGNVIDLDINWAMGTIIKWHYPVNPKTGERIVYVPRDYPPNTTYPVKFTSYNQWNKKLQSVVREVFVEANDTANIDAQITPGDTIKSGYGVTARVTTTLKNEENAEYTKITRVIATLPDVPSTQPVTLDLQSGSADATAVWQFPVNSQSPISARKIYVPVAYPDNKKFSITFTSYDQNDNIVNAITKSVLVNGNMYEDDMTMDIWVE